MEIISSGEMRVIDGVGHVVLDENETSMSHHDSYVRRGGVTASTAIDSSGDVVLANGAEQKEVDEEEAETISKVRKLMEREQEDADDTDAANANRNRVLQDASTSPSASASASASPSASPADGGDGDDLCDDIFNRCDQTRKTSSKKGNRNDEYECRFTTYWWIAFLVLTLLCLLNSLLTLTYTVISA